MARLHILVIRLVLGGVFAVVLSRFFYPDAQPVFVAALGMVLVGLAYLSEWLRQKRR
jgi:hypothetical protein